MTSGDGPDLQSELLAQAERQTKALESIQGAMSWALAIVIVAALIGLVGLVVVVYG